MFVLCLVCCLVVCGGLAALHLAETAVIPAASKIAGGFVALALASLPTVAAAPPKVPNTSAQVRHVVQEIQNEDLNGWASDREQAVARESHRLVFQTHVPHEIRVPAVRLPERPVIPPIHRPVQFDLGCTASSLGTRSCAFFARAAGGIAGTGTWTAVIVHEGQTYVYYGKAMMTRLDGVIARGDYVSLTAGRSSLAPIVVHAGSDVGPNR